MSLKVIKCILLFFILIDTRTQCSKLISIEKIYQNGVKAYSDERWSECIVQFEESLHLYKLYKTTTINCRLKCNSQEEKSIIQYNIEDLKMYETQMKKRNCLSKCLDSNFQDLKMKRDLEDFLVTIMETRKPYEYLQLCYFQMYMLPKAASSVYTYLVANPNDETMKNNLKYYVEQPEVDINEVIDFQSENYELHYQLGLKSYKESQWENTIGNMEEVLLDYMTTENNCRVACESVPEHEWVSEFVINLSNIIASLLTCRQQCQNKLKHLEYDSGIEYLAEILNYLQMSYYHLGRYEDAAKMVTSYLLIFPDDQDMLENRKLYSSLVDEKSFSERPDIAYYFHRDVYEKQLINIFHQGNNDGNNNSI